MRETKLSKDVSRSSVLPDIERQVLVITVKVSDNQNEDDEEETEERKEDEGKKKENIQKRPI